MAPGRFICSHTELQLWLKAAGGAAASTQQRLGQPVAAWFRGGPRPQRGARRDPLRLPRRSAIRWLLRSDLSSHAGTHIAEQLTARPLPAARSSSSCRARWRRERHPAARRPPSQDTGPLARARSAMSARMCCGCAWFAFDSCRDIRHRLQLFVSSIGPISGVPPGPSPSTALCRGSAPPPADAWNRALFGTGGPVLGDGDHWLRHRLRYPGWSQ